MSQIFTPDSKTDFYHFFKPHPEKDFTPEPQTKDNTNKYILGIVFLNFIGIVALVLNAGGVINIQWFFDALASELFSETETMGSSFRRDCMMG